MGFLSKALDIGGKVVGAVTGNPLFAVGADLVGGLMGRSSVNATNDANYAMQKEFAQNGIRWKVADAKAAGVHPLAALGAPLFQPGVSVQADNSMANAFAAAGNDIRRAVQAKTTPMERLQERLLNAQVEGQEVENAMKRSQLAKMSAPQMPPALPESGKTYVAEGYSVNPDGSIDITPSPDFAMANQNVISGIVPELKHFWRNQLAPSVEDTWRRFTGRGYKTRKINGKLYYRNGPSWYPYKK